MIEIIYPNITPIATIIATPQHLIEWTDDKVFVATGAPFDDVVCKGVCYKIGQANNAALYPGLGFGAIVSKAEKITDEMIFATVQAVASQAILVLKVHLYYHRMMICVLLQASSR